jgi:rRNA maturation protein Nop10
MEENCPSCGKKTSSSKPMKYTPFSRLAVYRRKALYEERKRKGLL